MSQQRGDKTDIRHIAWYCLFRYNPCNKGEEVLLLMMILSKAVFGLFFLAYENFVVAAALGDFSIVTSKKSIQRGRRMMKNRHPCQCPVMVN